MTSYEPGTYVKGDSLKVANTPAQAVALTFDGYKPAGAQAETVAEVDYTDLQAQAKTLGIPANQGKKALAKAIAETPTVVTEPSVDETD